MIDLVKYIEKSKEFVVRNSYNDILEYARGLQESLPKGQKVAITNYRVGVNVSKDEYNHTLCSATVTIFMYV